MCLTFCYPDAIIRYAVTGGDDMKRFVLMLMLMLSVMLMSGCALKTDGIMAELKERGYIGEYMDGEKVVKYDGVVPSKQVYYEYDIKDSESEQRYRIYFDETDKSKFTLYDYENRIWYEFRQDGNELTETARNKF